MRRVQPQVETHRVKALGYKARYLQAGSGPTLVLLASPLVFATTYRPLIEGLAHQFRVYAIELPGSGRSSRVFEPWDRRDYATWLNEFLKKLSLDSFTLVGHSNSGLTAIEYAYRYPEQVRNLVLVDSVGIGMPHGSLTRILLARLFDAVLELPLTLRGLPHVLYNAVRHRRNFFHQVFREPYVRMDRELSRLKVRSLIAWGGRDHTLPRSYAREMQRAIPGASYAVESRGNHDWLIERPAEFTDTIRRALTQDRP